MGEKETFFKPKKGMCKGPGTPMLAPAHSIKDMIFPCLVEPRGTKERWDMRHVSH